MNQKINNVNNNPVAQHVDGSPETCLFSSARDYSEDERSLKGVIVLR